MKTRAVLVSLLFVLCATNAQAVYWGFDQNGNFESWGPINNGINANVTDGSLNFNLSGGDPFIESPVNLNINGTNTHWLKFDVEYLPSPYQEQVFQIFYDNGTGYSEATSIFFYGKPGRHFYQIDVPRRLQEIGRDPNYWQGKTIARVRLDVGGIAAGTVKIHSFAMESYPHPDFDMNLIAFGGYAGHPSGWYPANQIGSWNVVSPGYLNLTVSGGDPHFQIPTLDFNPTDFRYVVIRQDVTGYSGNEPGEMETFGFPGTGGTGFARRGWRFYPNVGFTTMVVDMASAENASWLGASGSINSWRVDPTTAATSATFSYDRVGLAINPANSAAPQWDFSGSGQGAWVAARHAPYGGSALNVSGGAAALTGSGTLAMEALDMALPGASYPWLQVDVNVATSAQRTDFELRYQWLKDGGLFGDANRVRRFVLPTNVGTQRYTFNLNSLANQPGDHNGGWDGFVHGLLLRGGNGEAGVTSVTFDNVNLLASVAAPTVAGVQVTAARTVDVTFSQDMGASGMTAARYEVSGTGKGTLATNPDSVAWLYGHRYRLTWTGGEMKNGGNITITFTGTDAAGTGVGSPNAATHTGGGIGTPPQATTITPALTGPTNADSVAFSVTFSEPVQNLNAISDFTIGGTATATAVSVTGSDASYTATVQGITGDGALTLTVKTTSDVQDLAGNGLASSVTSSAVTIDNTAPAAFTPTAAPASWTAGTNFTITFGTTDASGINRYELAVDEGAYGTVTSPYALDAAAYATGTHTVHVRAHDNAGNARTSDVPIYIDRAAPTNVTAAADPASWTAVGSVSVTFSADDAHSGIDHYETALDGAPYTTRTSPYVLSGLATGVHTVSVKAVDACGNAATTDVSVYIDTLAPANLTAAADPASWTNAAAIGITFSANEPAPPTQSGFSHYEVAVDAGTYATATSPYSVDTATLPDGEHTVHVRALDNAGNAAATDVTIFVDEGAPANFTPTANPASWTAADSVTITFVTTDAYSGIAGYAIAVGEGAYAAAASPHPLDVSALPDGTHTVHVRATDGTGNSLTREVDIQIDRTAPQAFTPAVVPAIWTKENEVTVTFAASDASSGVAGYELSVGGGGYAAAASPYTLDTSAFADGLHTVRVRATDNVGNTGAPQLATVRIDRTGPVMTVTPLVTNDPTPQITGGASDPLSGPASVAVTVNSAACATSLVGAVWTANVAVSLDEGVYNVQVVGTDAAGNSAPDATDNELIIDLTDPEATITSQIINSATPTLMGTCDDANGFDRLVVTVNGKSYDAVVTPAGGSSYTWSLTIPDADALADGTYPVTALATDAAGNQKSVSVSNALIVDGAPPIAIYTLLDPQTTHSNVVRIQVRFNEPVLGSFTEDDVELTGSLFDAATFAVTGTDPEYIVRIEMDEAEQNGTIGISVGTDITDIGGYHYAGGQSDSYTIRNWYGFTFEPQDVRAYYDDAATFEVVADHAPGPVSYQWWFENDAKTPEEVGVNSSTLTVAPVVPGSVGEYWCVVTYDDADFGSPHASLEAAEHLRITRQPQHAEVAPGDAHVFTVDTQGGFPPFVYRWTQNGVSYAETNVPSLEIDDVQAANAGVYAVTIMDDNGDIEQSGDATLTVETNALPAAGATGLLLLATAFAAAVRKRLKK